jgi:hypothetical protein
MAKIPSLALTAERFRRNSEALRNVQQKSGTFSRNKTGETVTGLARPARP